MQRAPSIEGQNNVHIQYWDHADKYLIEIGSGNSVAGIHSSTTVSKTVIATDSRSLIGLFCKCAGVHYNAELV